jgi:hypothetical protein
MMINYRSSSLHFNISPRGALGSVENLDPGNVNWPQRTKVAALKFEGGQSLHFLGVGGEAEPVHHQKLVWHLMTASSLLSVSPGLTDLAVG